MHFTTLCDLTYSPDVVSLQNLNPGTSNTEQLMSECAMEKLQFSAAESAAAQLAAIRPAQYGLDELEADAKGDCRALQESVLRAILKLQQDTEYLQQ